MKRLIGIAFLLAVTPVAAQQVTIDYAKDVDFKAVKTFQYTETKETNAPDQLMAGRIVTDLKAELTAAGLSEVQDSPDIFVTYHMTSKEDTVLNTTGFGYGGFGRGWGAWGGGMANSTTTESTYTEGTLIVDAYQASDKKMIWRGTGTVTVATKPEKQEQQIQKVLNKMGAKWSKILQNQGE